MTRSNPLRELSRFGVSFWYDNISRGLIASGELSRLIREDGLRGLTSNPTIFEKAIGSSDDYDDAIRRLSAEGRGPLEIFEALAIEDIRAAADLFKPLYDETGAGDGYVSLELPPALARDAEGSHREALRLFKAVGRPNVMIKIPGTVEGVRAVEATVADGVPVNVTLLFSQERYAAVLEAYLKGLERRAAHKKDLRGVASVASFFVSRVDTAADKELAAKGHPELAGQAAIANAKLAYQRYKRELGTSRWTALAKAGAKPQRLLWASTSTKNPAYRDVVYIEGLIGPDTVNTIPPATVDAFRDHGVCRPSLEEGADEAARAWERLGRALPLPRLLETLEAEGLAAFAKSFETLLGQIAAKKELIAAESRLVQEGLDKLKGAMFAARLWKKDPALWKPSDKEHQKIIKRSLGWLTAPDAMAAGVAPIRNFAADIRKEGFEAAVVLGMGGSSLACEVFRACFPRPEGHPRLEVLDTTHPEAVRALEARLDLRRTFFIVSSKSGSTIEPNCLMDYFHDKAVKALGEKAAGSHFAAITDPGTSLEKTARSLAFRKVFINPSDIGGRYSALSFFGLVPAAVMGVDVELLLDRARAAARAASPAVETAANEALRLGAALGCHARAGQDKLTLCLPPTLEAFGLWIEQLVAESTGKEGRGVIPICGESLGQAAEYGRDRLFARLKVQGAAEGAHENFAELERAGHPAIGLELRDVHDLGAQFLLWEVATAAAGFLLEVDPFDQPDVQSAKDQTNALLSTVQKGALPAERAAWRAGGLSAYADKGLEEALRGRDVRLEEALAAHLGRLKPGDFVALLAYLAPSDDERRELEALRQRLRRLTGAPVVIEHGPRYLHSTGQLYKGGPDRGLFLMLGDPEGSPLPIPGRGFTFGTLIQAQARGDFAALLAAGRRVLRLELGPPGQGSLRALSRALDDQAPSRGACRS